MITETIIKMIIKRFFRLIWLSLSHFIRSCYLYIYMYIYTYIDDYQIVFDNWRLKDYFDNHDRWIRSFVIFSFFSFLFVKNIYLILFYILLNLFYYIDNLKYYFFISHVLFSWTYHCHINHGGSILLERNTKTNESKQKRIKQKIQFNSNIYTASFFLFRSKLFFN